MATDLEKKVNRAKRIISDGERRGRQQREVAPSRSTGHRRELQEHSKALKKVKEALAK